MRKRRIIFGLIVFLCIAAIVVAVCFLPYTDLESNDTGRDLPPSRTTEISKEDKKAIETAFDSSNADSLVIVDKHGLIYKLGDSDGVVNIEACKENIISALYGIAVDKGLIDINKTLAEIEFDDETQPLTDKEKQAKISDLLKARSGIYLYGVDDEETVVGMPVRGSQTPGEYYYRSNWEMDALGAIFEEQTNKTLGEAFYQWVAIPTQMKFFKPENVHYASSRKTALQTFRFYMCAEDLAKFSMLYLNDGKHQGDQILSKTWIEESFVSYSRKVSTETEGVGYGYRWWIFETKNFALGDGEGGQRIFINKKDDLAIVITNNTGAKLGDLLWGTLFGDDVAFEDAFELYELALAAKKKA